MCSLNPEAVWERRTARTELSAEQARALLAPVIGDAPFTLSPVGGGLVNSTFQVRWAGPDLALRLVARGPEVCAVEAALLAGVDVPVPKLLHAGATHLVTTWIAGRRWVDVLDEGGTAAARSAGEVLARLHVRTYTEAGFLGADLAVREVFPSLDQAWAGHLRELVAGPAGARLGTARRERLSAVVADNTARIAAEPLPFVLLHGDFKPTNLLIGPTNEIVAVLDWEFVWVGSRWSDVGQLLRWADRYPAGFVPAFLDGYAHPLPDDWELRASLLDLLNLVGFLDGDDRPRVHADAIERIDRVLRSA